MALTDKALDQLNEADLRALIDGGEVERRSLDFKLTLLPRTDGEKKEFLYDVSSFANAAGGHLVFGMREEAGRAAELIGIELANPDDEILAWEEVARTGIRPRIGLQSHAVGLANGKVAIVMRIDQSWNPPHQVTYNNAFRFYGRGSNGKYQLDVEELRSAFSLSASAIERIRNFRIERLAKVGAGDTPAPLGPGAKLVTHVLPLAGFTTGSTVDLRVLDRDFGKLVPIIGGLDGARYNLDGYFGYSRGHYALVFRNGCIEAVQDYGDPRGQPPTLPSQNIESEIMKHIQGSKRLLKELGVEPPIAIGCSIVGAKGYELTLGYERTHAFDRDAVILPDEVLTTFARPYRLDALPIIDMLWQAVGVPRSPNFDHEGNYNPQ